jgi:hypothetical protein
MDIVPGQSKQQKTAKPETEILNACLFAGRAVALKGVILF